MELRRITINPAPGSSSSDLSRHLSTPFPLLLLSLLSENRIEDANTRIGTESRASNTAERFVGAIVCEALTGHPAVRCRRANGKRLHIVKLSPAVSAAVFFFFLRHPLRAGAAVCAIHDSRLAIRRFADAKTLPARFAVPFLTRLFCTRTTANESICNVSRPFGYVAGSGWRISVNE